MSRPLSVVRRALRPSVVLVTVLSAFAASSVARAEGIDISHWQGSVTWSKVKADGMNFAFMKATEGTGYADPTLARNWAGAKAVGMYRSAYHFARPDKGTAAGQASFFVRTAGKFADKGDLPPVLDLEATGGLGPAALRTWVTTWLRTVEQLTGRVPILYCSPSFCSDRLGDTSSFARYPLWVAHYTTGAPRVPSGWNTWTFWQRTSTGRVAGISGAVDINRFNGTSAQLAALARSTGGTAAPAPAGPTVPSGAATALTLRPGDTAVTVRQEVTFTGALTRVGSSAAVPGQAVSLWSRVPGGAWSRLGASTTSTNGTWSLRAPVNQAVEVQARFAGTATYAASVSSTSRLTTLAPEVAARPAATVDLKAQRAVVGKGRPLVIYGHVRSDSTGVSGHVVRYYKRSPGSRTWIYVGRSTSKAPTGWHSMTIRPRVTRVWKAVSSGSTTIAPATSSLMTVRPR